MVVDAELSSRRALYSVNFNISLWNSVPATLWPVLTVVLHDKSPPEEPLSQ